MPQGRYWVRALVCALLAGVLGCLAWPARADGVVGSGTAASCSEGEFRSKLAAGGLITFNCGPDGHVIVLTGQQTVTHNTTIDGAGTVTLSGGNSTRLFHVAAGATLELRKLTVSNGLSTDGNGGAIHNDGRLLASEVVFFDNLAGAEWGGGAIVSNGELLIDASNFENNRAGNGGAIYARADTLTTITGSVFNSNRATNTASSGWGGALLLGGGARVAVTGSRFIGNSARNGGALYATPNSTLELDDSEIGDNQANNGTAGDNFGGGILNAGRLRLGNVRLVGNTVYDAYAGRAVDVRGGGGIANAGGGVASISGGVLGSNEGRFGGAVANFGSLTLDGVVVIDNRAGYGGGIYSAGAASAVIGRSTFFSNSAQSALGSTGEGDGVATPRGGAIYNANAQLSMTNTTLSANAAADSGGGILDSDGTVELTNVTIVGNTGAGLSSDRSNNTSTLTLINTLLAGNTAANCGSLRFNQFSSQFGLSSDASCKWSGTGNFGSTDAQLTPLADNGGPTQTHMPRSDSPLIDNGTGSNCPQTDQRGVARPQGTACDIGAVEFSLAAAPSPSPAPGNRRSLMPLVQR